jgi:hypothetical protein
MKALFAVFATALGWLIAMGPGAAAELLVLSSTAPDIKTGEIVDGAMSLSLPAGARVTLVGQDGQTVTLEGPFEGVPSGGAAAGDPGLLAKLSALVGGPSQDASSLGAVRSAGGGTKSAGPWVVDISRSGHHCVKADGAPELWRPGKDQAGTLALKRLSPAKRTKTTWPRGQATLPWPERMSFTDGATYMARMRGGSTAKRLVMHVVPADLPNDVHRAVWMADAGCVGQARRLLATLK